MPNTTIANANELSDPELRAVIDELEAHIAALNARRRELGPVFARSRGRGRDEANNELRSIEIELGEIEREVQPLYAERRRRAIERETARVDRARRDRDPVAYAAEQAHSATADERKVAFIAAVRQFDATVAQQLERVTAAARACHAGGIDPLLLLDGATDAAHIAAAVRRRLNGQPQLIEPRGGLTWMPQ